HGHALLARIPWVIMATTYSANLGLPTPAVNDQAWGPVLLALFAMLDAFTPLASGCVKAAETPSASLDVDVAPCAYRKDDGTIGTYAGGTLAVAASATRCLWLTDAGVLTAGSSFPTGSPIVRLAVVVAGSSTITSVTDARVVLGVSS